MNAPASTPDAPDHRILIRPNRAWLTLDFASFWEYRELLILLVRRDFLSKYRQTVLGPAWAVVQPVLMTLIFTVIFGKVAKMSTEGIPPTLFYLCGLLGWNYLSQTFTANAAVLVQNSRLFGKVYFPRMIVPVSTLLSGFIGYAIQLGTFIAFFIYFKFGPAAGGFGLRWQIVFLPLLLVHVGLLSLGTGLWMSSLTAKYRDLVQLTPVLVQLWMYATPVIYPLSMLPEEWRWVAQLNPMTAPTEACRYMFLGTGSLDLAAWVASLTITLTILLSGVMYFQRVERTFVDTV